MSDRSLDEFAAGDEGAETADADAEAGVTSPADPDAETADADAGVASPAAPDADPATPTMRWSTDHVACDACGDGASRRWRDGDAFVCADCKEW